MVQGLAFLSKKSWHTKNLANQEKVWMAEQRKAAEESKTKELAKQIQQEREEEELDKIAGRSSKKRDRGIDWMYEGGRGEAAKEAELKQNEEYLMGKEFQPQGGKGGGDFADLESGGVLNDVITKKPPAVEKQVPEAAAHAPMNAEPSVADRNEAFRMRHEDPMFLVSRKKSEIQTQHDKKRALYERVVGPTEDKGRGEDREARSRSRRKKERQQQRLEEKEERRHRVSIVFSLAFNAVCLYPLSNIFLVPAFFRDTVVRVLEVARLLGIVTIGDAINEDVDREADREVRLWSQDEAGARSGNIVIKATCMKLVGMIDREAVATSVGGIVREATVLVNIIVGVAVHRGEMTTIEEIVMRNESPLRIGAMRKGVARTHAIIRKKNALLARKALDCRVASLRCVVATAISVLIDSYWIENDKSEIQSAVATASQVLVVDA